MLEIGDVVRIRSDLVPGRCYGFWAFTSGMASLLGEDVTIKNVLSAHNYRIEEYSCIWTEEMFDMESVKKPGDSEVEINSDLWESLFDD